MCDLANYRLASFRAVASAAPTCVSTASRRRGRRSSISWERSPFIRRLDTSRGGSTRWKSAHPPKRRKALMFPKSSQEPSAQDFVDGLDGSDRMTRAFGAPLASARHCFPDRLEDLLVVLRAYKVARNHITHSGGRVTESTSQALADAALASHGFGHGKKDLQLPSIDGDRVVVGLLAAQGACSLVLKLVSTLDHALACTTYGEKEVVALWKERRGRVMLPAEKTRRDRRLRYLAAHGTSKPAGSGGSVLHPARQSCGHLGLRETLLRGAQGYVTSMPLLHGASPTPSRCSKGQDCLT